MKNVFYVFVFIFFVIGLICYYSPISFGKRKKIKMAKFLHGKINNKQNDSEIVKTCSRVFSTLADEEAIKNMCPLQYLQTVCISLQKEGSNDAFHADREIWDFKHILSCNDYLLDPVFDKCKMWGKKNECWITYLKFADED